VSHIIEKPFTARFIDVEEKVLLELTNTSDKVLNVVACWIFRGRTAKVRRVTSGYPWDTDRRTVMLLQQLEESRQSRHAEHGNAQPGPGGITR
jgi:hypothetical protein